MAARLPQKLQRLSRRQLTISIFSQESDASDSMKEYKAERSSGSERRL